MDKTNLTQQELIRKDLKKLQSLRHLTLKRGQLQNTIFLCAIIMTIIFGF